MQTPLVILTGFLGAGKTSFLQRCLPRLDSSVRPHVILNDYRNARVDAERLATLDAVVTPLNGDCVCCGSREELLAVLLDLQPGTGDAVVLEANGTTDSEELISMLMLDRRLGAFARPTQVGVVDALRWQRRDWHNALEEDQVATASHLWLNWTERAGAARSAEVEAAALIVNPYAERITPESFAASLSTMVRTMAEAPARRLPLAHAPETPADHAHHEHADHEHQHHFASLEVPSPPLVDREVLASMVAALPPEVVRAKGLVQFRDAPGEHYVWSAMRGDPTLFHDRVPTPRLAPLALFIGARLPAERLRHLVASLGATPASEPV
ncbi:MAG: GTP-binding protein [Betaproteobacteria bacterium]|nr:GTP-binding protein [Betaproteobacteria bacterium]